MNARGRIAASKAKQPNDGGKTGWLRLGAALMKQKVYQRTANPGNVGLTELSSWMPRFILDPMTCCGWRFIPHQSEDRYRPFWS